MFSLAGKSLYVEAIDLWIDSMRSRRRRYVSHGHSNHAREHAVIVAPPNTAKICRSRFTRRPGRPVQTTLLRSADAPRLPAAFEEHSFNDPWELGGRRITLFSAGHVLGSLQILIEGEAGRFVYTGDFKLDGSYTAEPTEVKTCDVVLMECTYGRPHYAFPPREDCGRDGRLRDFVHRLRRLGVDAEYLEEHAQLALF